MPLFTKRFVPSRVLILEATGMRIQTLTDTLCVFIFTIKPKTTTYKILIPSVLGHSFTLSFVHEETIYSIGIKEGLWRS